MRSVALIAALAGAAAAIDGLHWPRHFKASGTSVSVPSSSGAVPPPPSGHPSSLPGNPHPTSYSTPWSGPPSSVATGSSKASSYPWSSVIVPSGTVGPSTETITTITTTTVCPVTQTSGTQVITTLTTSTITITSCKGGCHQSTSPPSTPTGPSSIIVPTILTTGTWTFIPQSSSVGNNGHSTVYSTYLTSSYVTKTYSTELTVYPTSSVVVPPVVTPPVVTPPSGSCPAPATVTVTVTEAPAPPTNCPECTKTYTITESGTTTCITVTSYPTTTTTSIETGTGHPLPPHSTGTAPYSWSGTSRLGPKPTTAVWAW